MTVTRTAYGTWSAGRFMHFGVPVSESHYISLIQLALEKGIRTMMTADAYGTGEADRLLGEALKGTDRSAFCAVGAVGHDFYTGTRSGSKGFPRFTDPELRGPEGYGEYLKMATEKSLERCGLDHFDLLLLHNPDSTGYTSPVVWEAMAGLKASGLTKQLGIAPGPANGFTLDIIRCFELFGDQIDWAMLILNPLEPWPGQLALPAAEKFDVNVITRVVDYGGLFHDDVKPGHHFGEKDHRTFRPAGWVEAGNEKVEALRPIAERHGLTMLQLACLWNLSQAPVECVIPTLIQESGEKTKSIESKVQELAGLPESVSLSAEELKTIATIGNNKGCMDLKGASVAFEGDNALADAWHVNAELQKVGERWGIDPKADLLKTH